jgi:hypothetical protein
MKIRGDIYNFVYIVSANDTGDKLFTSVNDTGDNILPVSWFLMIKHCSGFSSVPWRQDYFITGNNLSPVKTKQVIYGWYCWHWQWNTFLQQNQLAFNSKKVNIK